MIRHQEIAPVEENLCLNVDDETGGRIRRKHNLRFTNELPVDTGCETSLNTVLLEIDSIEEQK